MKSSALGGDKSPFSCVIVTLNAREVCEERRFLSFSAFFSRSFAQNGSAGGCGRRPLLVFFGTVTVMSYTLVVLSCLVAVLFVIVCALKGKKDIST